MITAFWFILIALITGLAVWFDFRAYQKRLRALLIVLSGLLLLGFITEPKWWPSDLGKYALITDGFDSENFNPNEYDEVYSLRKEDRYRFGKKWLSSVYMLPDFVPEGSRIEIFGFGINEDLPRAYRFDNKLQEPEKGLLFIEAPQQIDVGREFDFSISMKGGTDADSIQVYKDGELWSGKMAGDSAIKFTDQISMQGPVTYDIEWISGDSLLSESLNIRAVQPELLTFGILMYSPSFEVNDLAEHFGERGHTVISRIRIGEERFRYDAVNATVGRAESIFDQLSSMDVLILDSREYPELPISVQEQIKEAVINGLDILLTAPQLTNRDQWSEVFEVLTSEEIDLQLINRLEERNWVPEITGTEDRLLTPLPILNANFSNRSESVSVLHEYTGNEPVSIRVKSGSGSVTGQLFYQTYGWLLEGETDIYNHFWSDYLSRIIKLENTKIETAPMISRVNKRTEIIITQPLEFERLLVKSVFSSDSLYLPVMQKPENPEVTMASFRAEIPGWHVAEYAGQKRWFYVYGDSWEFDRDMNRYQHTGEQIEIMNALEIQKEGRSNTKIPDRIWLIGFLVLQTILWAERKFV